jgi:hypothetical protein
VSGAASACAGGAPGDRRGLGAPAAGRRRSQSTSRSVRNLPRSLAVHGSFSWYHPSRSLSRPHLIARRYPALSTSSYRHPPRDGSPTPASITVLALLRLRFVECVWRCHSWRAGTFLSMLRATGAARDSPTRAGPADCASGGDAADIGRVRPMPSGSAYSCPSAPAAALPGGDVHDRRKMDLPVAGSRAFRLNTPCGSTRASRTRTCSSAGWRGGPLAPRRRRSARPWPAWQALARSASATSGWRPASRTDLPASSSPPVRPPACCATSRILESSSPCSPSETRNSPRGRPSYFTIGTPRAHPSVADPRKPLIHQRRPPCRPLPQLPEPRVALQRIERGIDS